MPLVLETKIADVSILISLGNLLARGTTWLVPKTTSATSISFRVFGAYYMTRILYKYAHLPTLTLFSYFHLQGQHTLSSVTFRENTHTLSILTNRVNTLFLLFTFDFRYKNGYFLQPFSSLLYFVGETFSSLENRNFVKPQKETNKQ